MKRVYTGFENCFLYIRKLSNKKYIIDSKDRAFIEYYVGNDSYNTYGEAVARIDEINKLHKLFRFNTNNLVTT